MKSIYDIPIAVKNLHYILAKNLYGQQKNFFTVFDLIEELISLISLTRKRKVLLLNDQANVGNYKIKNITYGPYLDEDPPFQRTVYISKIGIYDKDKNLIGVAKTATPIRKTEKNQYTFKLKLDI